MLLRQLLLQVIQMSKLAVFSILCSTSISMAQPWSTKAPMPTARNIMPTVEINGIIYAIGGILGGLTSIDTVEAYDTNADSWTNKTPLPIPLGSSSGCVFNDKIYIFGGSINGAYGTIVDSVYQYTPSLDTWSKKSNLPKPLSGSVAQSVNGKIYVIGGTSESFSLAYNSVYEYDPVSDTWDTAKTPMPTARFNHSSAVVDDKIYVFGGATNNTLSPISSVEVYDPLSDTWDTTKAPMPIAKCLHTSSASNGKIYIFSGASGFSILYDTVEEYDPVLDKWTEKTPIPTARWSPGSCTVGENIYVIGGAGINNSRLSIVEEYHPELDITGVEEQEYCDVTPSKFTLFQNYPNPFNPSTTIKYSIPSSSVMLNLPCRQAGSFQHLNDSEIPKQVRDDNSFGLTSARLNVFDILGRHVATLVNEEKPAGTYEIEFNGHSDEGQNLTSGVYFYRLQSGNFVETKKMILLR